MRPPTDGRVERARAKAAKARRRRTLGLDAIVDVALRIVDTEGVDAVSMRRVAAEFDTGPASLYAYVKGKDELLNQVLTRVIDQVEVPDGDDWQDVVRSYCWSARAVMSAHNDVARLTFGTVPGGERMVVVAERLLGVMIDGGVPRQVAAWALDVLALYIAADCYEGWLYDQVFDDGSGRPTEEVGAEYFGGLAARFDALPRDRYPALTSSIPEMLNGGGDERFGFAIDMFIAGFAAQVPRARRRTTGRR